MCVVDPDGTSQAESFVKFAAGVGIPCVLVCDADGAGKKDQSKLPASALRVWVTGTPDVTGDLEAVLCAHDEECCLRQSQEWDPQASGSAQDRLRRLKGTYGSPLGRAFVADFPDVSAWPPGFQRLVARSASPYLRLAQTAAPRLASA